MAVNFHMKFIQSDSDAGARILVATVQFDFFNLKPIHWIYLEKLLALNENSNECFRGERDRIWAGHWLFWFSEMWKLTVAQLLFSVDCLFGVLFSSAIEIDCCYTRLIWHRRVCVCVCDEIKEFCSFFVSRTQIWHIWYQIFVMVIIGGSAWIHPLNLTVKYINFTVDKTIWILPVRVFRALSASESTLWLLFIFHFAVLYTQHIVHKIHSWTLYIIHRCRISNTHSLTHIYNGESHIVVLTEVGNNAHSTADRSSLNV